MIVCMFGKTTPNGLASGGALGLLKIFSMFGRM